MQADPAIQRAARLLAADLPGLAELARSNVETSETELIKAYQARAAALPFEERRELLRRIRATNRLKKALPGFFRDLTALASGIGATHAALREAVQEDLLRKALDPDQERRIRALRGLYLALFEEVIKQEIDSRTPEFEDTIEALKLARASAAAAREDLDRVAGAIHRGAEAAKAVSAIVKVGLLA